MSAETAGKKMKRWLSWLILEKLSNVVNAVKLWFVLLIALYYQVTVVQWDANEKI
jgi:hypothetical protein